MADILNVFGSHVFNEAKMKERLKPETFASLNKTIKEGAPLDLGILDEVADAIKVWALENGATHFTHWFLPLTTIPAEKHDSFIDFSGDDIVLKFNGKTLLKGEPDASSFPSGGLRSTANARGYTIWDPTTPVFIRTVENRTVLFIPTVFVGYHGEALDRKIPLLRSLNALNKAGKRFMKMFGYDAKRVYPAVGPEQEYFLVDRDLYLKRDDLIYTGRTMFGVLPPKGQELMDHYFAGINSRVTAFMKDINEELWSLGITAKTDHNEVAPLQHETATIFSIGGLAADQNMMLMETLQRTARKHNLVCLLHEKPFAHINGSGKHNNWSVNADNINLTDPTDTPEKNWKFLLTLACIIEGVDENAVLLRACASNPGNDFRLGANEAPPAILSIYLGDQLLDIVEQIINNGEATSSIHPHSLDLDIPQIGKITAEATDRNRTSPFAFTGNKFEFRMLASSVCIASANTALNTIMAYEFNKACDALENSRDFEADLKKYIRKTIIDHKRVIFNGDGYTTSWPVEAEKRGLPNVKTYIEAVSSFTTDKTVSMFNSLNVLSDVELKCRQSVAYEMYAKNIDIEAKTALLMLDTKYFPAIRAYAAAVAAELNNVDKLVKISAIAYKEHLDRVVTLLDSASIKKETLKTALMNVRSIESLVDKALAYLQIITPILASIRTDIDALEEIVSKSYWPVPCYSDLFIED